ncbi:MAG: hypothetical protein ATN36_06885 [Epulopiscium sp. Nele67-Bin005]|nr:MAG: hypothetical protein ATN36_06885 [Epulopiscium sp. Nele67-Bin005]
MKLKKVLALGLASMVALVPIKTTEATGWFWQSARYYEPILMHTEFGKHMLTATLEEGSNIVRLVVAEEELGTNYTIKVVEARNNVMSHVYEPQEKVSVDMWDEKVFEFQGDLNRNYSISLWNGEELLTSGTMTTPAESRDPEISTWIAQTSHLCRTQEGAEALMVTVEIPIWLLQDDGSKLESSTTVTVHPAIAETTVSVFTEIFNGEEQFPIRHVGGYSWRGEGSSSYHNLGLALDINYAANYAVYSNGNTVGTHWTPNEDPYSILPYGEVVRAFENHGWHWGGDVWASPLDYMHFGY